MKFFRAKAQRVAMATAVACQQRGAAPSLPLLPPLLPGLLAFLAGGVFLWQAGRFFNVVEDDAFIPLRYAQQFWRVGGWGMNPGERVEGCTSPLHLLLVTALLGMAGPDTCLWLLKGLGVVLGVAILWRLPHLGRCLYPDDVAGGPRFRRATGSGCVIGGAAALWLASRPEWALAMTNGLETPLVTFLVFLGTLRWLEAPENTSTAATALRAAPLLSAAALARPEAAALFPLLALVTQGTILFRRHPCQARSSPARIWAYALLAWALPLVLLQIFRLLYWGDWVPNTYWAKRLPLAEALPMGWEYLRRYALPLPDGAGADTVFARGFEFSGLGTLWAATALLLFAALARRCLLVLAVAIWWAFFVLTSGGTWMMDGRFGAPALPLLFLVWCAPLAAAALVPPKSSS